MAKRQKPKISESSAGTRARLSVEMPKTRSAPEGSQRTPYWDIVDEASWESFPASDPPGYHRGLCEERVPPPAGTQRSPQQIPATPGQLEQEPAPERRSLAAASRTDPHAGAQHGA